MDQVVHHNSAVDFGDSRRIRRMSGTTRRQGWRACVLLVAALTCVTVQSSASELTKRILFIGNSLTYTIDLTAMAAFVAAGCGRIRLQVDSVAKPNFSLEDHWNDGEAARAIRGGGWDVVVMQQGPSAMPDSRDNLLTYARKFNEVIRQAGAMPAFLAVWPSRERSGDFDRVVESYRLAAETTSGILIPAGTAWQAALREGVIPVYGPDGFHPSREGSYLAAMVLVGTLCRDCRTSGLALEDWITPAMGLALRRAAESALRPTRPLK
jgi:hypothetical protein